MAEKKIRKKDCVRLSNKIIQRCQLPVAPVTDVSDIRSNLFIALLQVLCGPELPPGVIPSPSSLQEEADNVQAIINYVALDLIHVDLNHITGAAVISGDPRAIYNLLEIFCGLHKYLSSTDIGDKWNLEESLTETEEEASGGSSSSDKGADDGGVDGSAKPPLPPMSYRGTIVKPSVRSTSGSGSMSESISQTTPNVDTTSDSKTDNIGTSSSKTDNTSFPTSENSVQEELPLSPTERTSATAPPVGKQSRDKPATAGPSGIIPANVMPSTPQLPGSGKSTTSDFDHMEPPVEHQPKFSTGGAFEPRHFDFPGFDNEDENEEAAESEEEASEEDDVGVEPGTLSEEVDYSQQLSDEMQQLKESSTERTSSGTEPSSEKEQTPVTTVTDSQSQTISQQDRYGKSAPCTPAAKIAAANRMKRRLQISDCTSVSDPGIGRKIAGRRPLLTRNIETIAEIHESGGECSTVHKMRDQRGNRLCREVTRKELRRKIHSAPITVQMESLCRQSGGQSTRSDDVIQWLESQDTCAGSTAPTVQGQETDVFEFLRREFPYAHISDETKRKLLYEYRQQMRYIMSLTEPTETRKYKVRRQDILKRQALLTDIIRQQKQHDRRFQKIKEQRRCEIMARNAPRDAKIACLRAQRYVESFKHQFRARMALNKNKEEQLLKSIFGEMLEIQRIRLRTVRRQEKEAIIGYYGEDGYTTDLNKMLQFYEANFRDITQMLQREREDLRISEKEQQKLADRIRREFRAYMESDVKTLHDKLVNSWQPQYRDLDADRVRGELYQANWKFCVT